MQIRINNPIAKFTIWAIAIVLVIGGTMAMWGLFAYVIISVWQFMQ